MGIRDQEISRLIKYAEGLGLKVKTFSSEKIENKDAAAWTVDGTEIWIYKNRNTSKTEMILSLIHELGHHLDFIHKRNRNPDYKLEEAMHITDIREEVGKIVPKKVRKKALSTEIDGTAWWESIYKETNIKIPIWKLHASIEFDIWMYEVYYETGHFPKREAMRAKHKELKIKYRK